MAFKEFPLPFHIFENEDKPYVRESGLELNSKGIKDSDVVITVNGNDVRGLTAKQTISVIAKQNFLWY
eukprot:UN05798